MYDKSNPRVTWIDRLSQRTRRFIAVASLVGLPAMYLWSSYWTTTDVPRLIWGPVSFLLIGMTGVGAIVLYRFVRDRADVPGGNLDERQRHIRERAYIASYVVLSTVVVAGIGLVAVLVLGMGRTVVLDGALVSAVAISVGTLLPLLPIAALAWIEPNLPADE